MLSGVPGLRTFSMVTDDVLESTSGLPTSVHVTLGSGSPDTSQNKVMLSPSFTVSLDVWFVIDGGSVIKSKLKRIKLQKYTCIL